MLALLAGCSQGTPTGYTIDGQVTDLQDGVVYLQEYVDKNYNVVDSAVIQNGKFTFEGSVESPLLYGLTTLKDDKAPLTFFLDNAPLQVTLAVEEKKLDVSGSATDALYRQVLAKTERDDYTVDSLLADCSNSAVAPYFIMRSYAWELDASRLQGALDKLSPSLANNLYTQQMKNLVRVKESLQVGKVAPDFALPDSLGNSISLSSFRGRYVLVDFWASWCPDCRKEIPDLLEVYEQYKDKNFTLFSVSLDRAREPWLAAIEKYGLKWTHVSDLQAWQSPIVSQYAIRWIPTTFLIDPEGKILHVALNSEEMKAGLEKAFQ